MKIYKKQGIVFWITGLSGSGKTTIGNHLKKKINENYGKTVIINGDDIRNVYHFNNYKPADRLKLGKSNSDLCKLISDQGINVIFTTVGLFHKLHKYNRSQIKNYVEIYIESNIKNLINMKKKNFYKNKTKFVWGLDIQPEYPKRPTIVLKNNFNISTKKLSEMLIKDIDKKLNFTN